MRKRSYLTVRNLPPDVAVELERQRKRQGASLNQTVVDALRRGLGLGQERMSNGLAALAGKWDEEEFEAFERAVHEIGEQVDEELWR
jgi:plasmid stability protein